MGFYGVSDVVAYTLVTKALDGRCWAALKPFVRDDGSVWWDGAADAVEDGQLPPAGWSAGEKELLRTAVAIGAGAGHLGTAEWGPVAEVLHELLGPR